MYLDQVTSVLQTGLLVNMPKSGYGFVDMLVMPLVIGIIGSLVAILKQKSHILVAYLKKKFRGQNPHAANIEYLGSIHYLSYKTRVQLDLGMAAFFYYLFNNLSSIEGLQHLRRIPDLQRDWSENDDEIVPPQIFEEFFISQDKMITLPCGLKIYPSIENKNEADDSPLGSKGKSVKVTTYGITVVYDKLANSDLNMKYLLEKYQTLKNEYLEFRENKINNDHQYVYMFSHKSEDRVYFDKYSINKEPKRMEHIFFPGKQKLLEQIEYFTQNRDYFYQKGKPYRKVILAHGEPGCGKTSFLMSLINMVKCQRDRYPRQLIHLKLDELTRKDLMNILFKETILVDNCSETSVKIPFDRRIYYIEEIDGYKATHNRLNSDPDDWEQVELLRLLKQTEKSKPCAIKSQQDNNTGKKNNDSDNGNGKDSDSDTEMDRDIYQNLLKQVSHVSHNPHQPQKLGIQDILEALDGIPSIKHGEIIFMTTNHLEKIDPALIRPGRVNHLLHFKKASQEDMISQIEHFYQQPLAKKYHNHLKADQFTPAEIEALCDSNRDMTSLMSKIIKTNPIG